MDSTTRSIKGVLAVKEPKDHMMNADPGPVDTGITTKHALSADD